MLEFPEKIQFLQCKRCSKILVQRNWVEFTSIELTDFIKTKVKAKDFVIQVIEAELEEAEKNKFNALIEVKGLLEGIPLILNGLIKLEFLSGICDSCMKVSSDYFEATIQARFNGKNIKLQEKILEEFTELFSEMQRKDPLARLVKTGKDRKGFDLIVSSNRAAKISSEKLARKYSSKVTRSFTLIGVDKSGKPKRRYTYCVRF